MGFEPYNKPCKKCGSNNQLLFIDTDRKSSVCQDCGHIEDFYVSPELQQKWAEEKKVKEQAEIAKAQSVPKCPICQSTNIKKISFGKKAAKTLFFGVLGAVDDAGKTYRCENCGSKF